MTSFSEWETYVESRPSDAHLLQTAAWAQLKSDFGWRSEFLRLGDIGASILLRPLPMGFSIAYLPRGPIPASIETMKDLLPDLDRLCRTRRSVFLKVEPDLPDGNSSANDLRRLGFQASSNTVQPPRTILVNLLGSEAEILARMKPKTRYNIRLAQKHGVTVNPSEDIRAFTRLMDTTSLRDAFSVHSEEYYRSAFEKFSPNQNVALLLASFQGAPIAGLMVFAQGRRSWYLYGASSDLHREVMAPHLLQWEAIRWARGRGCEEYDLWGIPDADEETLESQFSTRQDGLWGVYRFKRGFGGRIWRSVGTWDRIYHLPLYRLYRLLMASRARSMA